MRRFESYSEHISFYLFDAQSLFPDPFDHFDRPPVKINQVLTKLWPFDDFTDYTLPYLLHSLSLSAASIVPSIFCILGTRIELTVGLVSADVFGTKDCIIIAISHWLVPCCCTLLHQLP